MHLDFNTLRKNSKKDCTGFPIYKLAILGDTSTQFLNQAIKGSAYAQRMNFSIYEADYNQINQQVFSSSSELYHFEPDFILLFHSTQKLLSNFQLTDDQFSFSSNHLNYLNEIVQSIKNNSAAKIICFNYLEYQDGVFGNYANQLVQSFIYQIRKLNYELMNIAIQQKFFICDISSLNNIVGFKNSYDPKLYITADFVFSLEFTAMIAKNIIDIILPVIGRLKKCLILDLDNTVWGGVIGDDGIGNIEIGELGLGKSFTQLQCWAKQLRQRGIILAVCSKNTESIAKEAFEKHPDMVLRLDDISVFVANWDNKADNIRYIQSILNIGFDSMVFLDDNAFERELVKRELPDITVPELPIDPVHYMPYLTALNLFETASFSAEDIERTKQYQEETKRGALKHAFTSEEDYLASLNMEAYLEPFNKYNIPRVAQLTQRSNQFNLRTIRYTEDEVLSIANDSNYTTLSFTLKDKYGEYGLIAAIVLKLDKNIFFVDTWVMSCRVLKRGMEHFIINTISELAYNQGVHMVIGEYIPTAKNKIVENLYKSLGFTENGKFWELRTNKKVNLKTHINAKH